MSTTDQATWTALWAPGWYELDQAVSVGQQERFWFYRRPPADFPEVESYNFVFFNQLTPVVNCQVRTARVIAIDHAHLGPLERIETEGLDYTYVKPDGTRILVNAEEDPGAVFDDRHGLTGIDDWSVSVLLAEVSDPLVDN